MHKKFKGYLTVEASFVIPMVLFLYVLIITAALFLYSKCVISQDGFLLCMRASGFTWGEEGYGEVIYGENIGSSPLPENYIKKRIEYKQRFYPCVHLRACEYDQQERYTRIGILGDGLRIVKETQKINPVELVRERRNGNV